MFFRNRQHPYKAFFFDASFSPPVLPMKTLGRLEPTNLSICLGRPSLFYFYQNVKNVPVPFGNLSQYLLNDFMYYFHIKSFYDIFIECFIAVKATKYRDLYLRARRELVFIDSD